MEEFEHYFHNHNIIFYYRYMLRKSTKPKYKVICYDTNTAKTVVFEENIMFNSLDEVFMWMKTNYPSLKNKNNEYLFC